MGKVKLFFVGVCLASTALFCSCASYPQVELDSATEAVSSVKAAGASEYVSSSFLALSDSLGKAQAILFTEKSEWFKTYKASKASLAGVVNYATLVATENANRKAELAKENESLVTSITSLVNEDRELLKTAPKGKEGTTALASIFSDISTVESTLTEAKTLIASEDLLGANAKLKVTAQKATEIKAELTSAITKVTLKKKGKKLNSKKNLLA